MLKTFLCRTGLFVVLCVVSSLSALAQAADSVAALPGRSAAPTVYIDCRRCDLGFLRQEVQFVNYVRDPEMADIHVFVTNERTGSGGQRYILTFTGRKQFAGVGHILAYTSSQTDTYNEERGAVTETIKVGLVPYLIRTPLAGRIAVDVDAEERPDPQPANDPWNSWVFDLEGSGSLNLEESTKSYSFSGSAEASRVTEAWKIISRVYGNFNERRFEQDDSTIVSTSRRNGFHSRGIKSLTGHWSAGVYGDVYNNTFRNIDLGLEIAPAVEYNFFPYSESSRRQWVFVYRVGTEYHEYIEQTIYEEMDEMLVQQTLGTSISIRQPWGFVNAGLEGSHYFHDLTKNSIDLYSNLSVRLARGLSVRFSGGLEIINDQLYLPAGDVPLEDLLLQRRQLATAYELSGSVGLAYTFGSIYNNVVNTRL